MLLKLAKVVDSRRFLFSFDHKKGSMYLTECFPKRVVQKGRRHTIKTKSSILRNDDCRRWWGTVNRMNGMRW